MATNDYNTVSGTKHPDQSIRTTARSSSENQVKMNFIS